MGNLKDLRRAERAQLLSTLRDLGPEAPTLCAGWTAADIAAHLAMAERYVGIPMTVLYPLRKAMPEAVRARLMARLRHIGDRQTAAMRHRGWDQSLRRLSAGPPPTYDLSWVAPIRLVEEWIHHEDVRRANGSGPRPADLAPDEALWQCLIFLSRFAEFTGALRTVRVELPDGRSLQLRAGQPEVTITGPAGEVLLFLSGRDEVARVETEGTESALARLKPSLTV